MHTNGPRIAFFHETGALISHISWVSCVSWFLNRHFVGIVAPLSATICFRLLFVGPNVCDSCVLSFALAWARKMRGSLESI